jgi:hypothetical protein
VFAVPGVEFVAAESGADLDQHRLVRRRHAVERDLEAAQVDAELSPARAREHRLRGRRDEGDIRRSRDRIASLCHL